MFSYIPNTKEDINSMLDTIGVSKTEELFNDIKEDVKLNRELNLKKPMSELEVSKYINALGDKNCSTKDYVCFMGAGSYDHYIPAVIKHITSRSEFYTAYTPYQPEISQGTLQVIFEYQSMICRLTGLEAANASLYDGATACQEAMFMAAEATRSNKVIVSKAVNPETRRVLKTYARFKELEIVEIDTNDGATDIDKLKQEMKGKVAAVIVQNPNFFGIVEDLSEVEKITHSNKALLIMSVDPISLGILKTPGEIGADIAIGEAQCLGNTMSFGGPYIGFMATTSKYMRKMPGRIVGETNDVDGKRGFVLTLQAREQHIRREKATSNICSNEALNALAAAVYMTVMGKEGIIEVAKQCVKKSHYAYNEMIKKGLCTPVFNKPFFKEFAVSFDKDSKYINNALLQKGIIGGFELSKQDSSMQNNMLFCVTEKRTKQEIDNLIYTLEGLL